MSRITPVGTNAVIAALSMPTQQWGQVMAAKDQQLQQQMYLSQVAEQDVLKEQQAQQQMALFNQKLRSLPLERPDKQRVTRWLLGQEKEVAKRLERYGGNMTKFMAAEGSLWMQHTLDALENSDEYKTGIANLEQVLRAKEAMQKGENLVGDVREVNGVKQYVPATQQLEDYYAGRKPNFQFKGSYKDDNELVKHFDSTYAPGKLPFERTAVSEDEKLNYLLSTNQADVALDKYLRKYQNAQVFYKTKSLDEQQDFLNKQEDQAFQRRNQATKEVMDAARYTGIQRSNELKRRKLAGESGDAQAGGRLLDNLLLQSTDLPAVRFDSTGPKTLPHSGYDLNRFKSGDAGRFKAVTLYGDKNRELIGEKLGLTYSAKQGWSAAGGRPFKDAIAVESGFHALDLSKSNYKVVGLDNKLYTNPLDFDQQGRATDAKGVEGFARVELEFDDDEDASAAGLINDWSPLDFTTKAGTGVYNRDTKRAWLMVPMGRLTNDWTMQQQLLKNMSGQKMANEFYNGMALGGDDDDE